MITNFKELVEKLNEANYNGSRYTYDIIDAADGSIAGYQLRLMTESERQRDLAGMVGLMRADNDAKVWGS